MRPLTTLLLAVCLATSCSPALAEDEVLCSYAPQNYSVLPASPQVASLMRLAELPVSPFTGQPDITLPLHTVRQGSLVLPIAISYHGGGIKVDEMSGMLGLGWSLMAGGCVSRSIKGLPDEMYTGKYGYHGLLHLDATERAFRDSILGRQSSNPYIPYNSRDHILSNYYCDRYNEGKTDVANDIFSFSFMGNRGTFINDPSNGRTVFSSASAVRLAGGKAHAPQRGWNCIMLDDVGNRYEFNSLGRSEELTRYKYDLAETGDWSVENVPTAWYLDRIVSSRGDTVSLKYKTHSRKVRHQGILETYSATSDLPENGQITRHTTIPLLAEYDEMLLSEISTRSETVTFEYADGSDKLLAVTVCRRSDPSETVKKFGFRYTSFGAGEGKDFLSEVVEEDISGGKALALYKFGYTIRSAEGLSTSLSQDHWGYYNGAENTSLVVTPEGGSDRTPREVADNGVLSEIKYATGGGTRLTWELNDYGYLNGSPVGHYVDTVKTDRSHDIYGGSEYDAATGQYGRITKVDQVADKRWVFNMREGVSTLVTVDISNYVEPLESTGMGPWIDGVYNISHTGTSQSADPRLVVLKPDGSTQTIYIDRETATRAVLVSTSGPGEYVFALKNPTNFEGVDPNVINGYYGNGAERQGTKGFGYVHIGITETATVDHDTRHPWGGLRIKEITAYDSTGVCAAVSRKYSYTDSWEGKCSSGSVIEAPDCANNLTETYTAVPVALNNSGTTQVKWQVTTTRYSSGVFSTPEGSAHVEYPNVWESLGDSLLIHHIFSSQRDQRQSDMADATFPDLIPVGLRTYTSRGFMNGDLLGREYYIGGNLYKREKYSTAYSKDESGLPVFCGDFFKITDLSKMNMLMGSGPEQYSCDYTTSKFRLIPFAKVTQEINVEEFDGANGAFTTCRRLSHYGAEPNTTTSRLVRSETQGDSDGSETETFYTYAAINGMPSSLKETEVTVKNGYILSARRNVYDSRNNLVATYRAKTGMAASRDFGLGESYRATATLIDAINVPEYSYVYDDYNNLIQISYKGAVLASYIWGYKGSHPVAEILATPYEKVCMALPADLQPASLADRCDITGGDMARIRAALAGAEVTTITYDWLVGAGTVTGPGGGTTSFSYDGFGRLETERDVNGFYIRKYNYHYANQ